MKKYTLPKLPYGFESLSPFMSSDQLRIHYEKHHKSYVIGANKIIDEIESARRKKIPINSKRILKDFSFNIGGHILHSLFWRNLSPEKQSVGEKTKKVISKNFKSFGRFKEEFSQAALSVEGSGWAALVFCREAGFFICQIEKHNTNIYPSCEILMVLDVFEHAYYLDYKNDRAEFINRFWDFIDWREVENRIAKYAS